MTTNVENILSNGTQAEAQAKSRDDIDVLRRIRKLLDGKSIEARQRILDWIISETEEMERREYEGYVFEPAGE